MPDAPINSSMETTKTNGSKDYSKLPIFERECDAHLDDFKNLVDLSDLTITKKFKTNEEIYHIPLPMARSGITFKIRKSAKDPEKYVITDGASMALKWMDLGVFAKEYELQIMVDQMHEYTDFKMDGDKVISVECDADGLENAIENFLNDMLIMEIDLEGYRFTKMMMLDWPSSFMTCCDGSPYVLDESEDDFGESSEDSEKGDKGDKPKDAPKV